jgi:hypothetical protein
MKRLRISCDSSGSNVRQRLSFYAAAFIGSVEIVEAVKYAHQSPWSFGPYGFVLRDPEPCPFIPSN